MKNVGEIKRSIRLMIKYPHTVGYSNLEIRVIVALDA